MSDSVPIYSGDEANDKVWALAQKRKGGMFGAGEAVTTGVDYFDQNNPPLMRGEVALLIGLTSHGKTLYASTMAKHTLDRLGNSGKRGLLIVMTEETVEARRVQMWGDARVTIRGILTGGSSLEAISDNIAASAGQPVYFMGQTTDLADVGTTDGIMRASTIVRGLEQLFKLGIEPELVLLDHAHDLEPDKPYHGEAERYEAVSDELKQLANGLAKHCPLVILGQCNKDVEKRPPAQGQPNAYDLKFMQGLAARARDIYTIYYPQRHNAIGMKFPTVHGQVMAAKGTFLVHAAKARNGRCAGETLAMTAMDDSGQWSNQLHEARF